MADLDHTAENENNLFSALVVFPYFVHIYTFFISFFSFLFVLSIVSIDSIVIVI